MKVINDLLGYRNYKIIQDTDMFSFSLDSILLPNFVTLNKNIDKILDIGCGNAPIPLILSTKTKANIIGVEIQQEVYKMACESININNLNSQIKIINADINEYYKKIESDTFDVITCNPPFFKYKSTSNINDSDYKTLARHEVNLNLDQLFLIARKLLKNNGVISIVHRPERFVEIVEKMKKNNIEPKRVRFIYPKSDSEANILLIEGKKNGNPGVKILPPLFVHLENGSYTKEIQNYFE